MATFSLRLIAGAFLALCVSSAHAEPGLYPPGFTIFCEEFPTECEPTSPVAPLKMSEWKAVLDRVNRDVNAAITYQADAGHIDEENAEILYERVGRGDVPDGDRWAISPEFGDCDDYTVTKRQKLIDAGAPRGALRIAYVLPVEAEPHLFLIVATDEGDFVLDNRSSEIYELERAMITRLSMQDAVDPRTWKQIF